MKVQQFSPKATRVLGRAAFAVAMLAGPASATLVNQPIAEIAQIVARDTGQTSIFLTNPAISSADGCSSDRAVLLDSDLGAKSLLATTMMAFSLEKPVEIAVDGCVLLSNSNSLYVPRIVKVKIVR
ncbi:MAG: hypothetical protein HYZ17_14185 [Betaproteobacteria bacterium]|nr:hypothetical protein [Betaproteobacteria bacterium]